MYQFIFNQINTIRNYVKGYRNDLFTKKIKFKI